MSPAREEAQRIRRTTYAMLVLRRELAREVTSLGKRMTRAPLREGQIGNVLKLHTLWCRLGEVEGLLQRLTGTPPEEAGVWPSRVPRPEPETEAP